MADIIPDPSVYEGETAAALQAYNSALASIAARRSNTLQNYGFTAQVDPNTGALGSYSIDPNNQYGQVQTLLGNEGANLDTLRSAAAARGIGQVGLGAQGADRYRFQMGGEQAGLGRQFVGEIGSEAADQVNAGDAYNTAKVQAQRDALMAAIQNGWFNQVSASASGDESQPQPLGAGGSDFAPAPQRAPLSTAAGSYYGVLSPANPTQYATPARAPAPKPPVKQPVVSGNKNANSGYFALNTLKGV